MQQHGTTRAARGMSARGVRRSPPARPAGRPLGLLRRALAGGARALQRHDPLRGFDAYVVGFHCGLDEPHMQMEAHHYCKQVNDDLMQCVIFDGNTRDANLIGVEYIVSERLFATLPDEERPSWHPHNYEILSGSLIAPGLPERVERAFLALLVNSYGKTWHTWHSGRHDEGPGDRLPVGPAMLMWSFNRDGEADSRMEQHRDAGFGISTADRRRRRSRLARRARPQEGVDRLADAFPSAGSPPPGVVDARRTR